MNVRPIDNRSAAVILTRLADLMEILGEDDRRARAYRRAAQSVDSAAAPVNRLAEEGKLRELPGVGPALEEKLREILETGTCTLLEELQARVPESLLALLHIPGIGPRTVHLFYSRLGIEDEQQLEEAAIEGRLRDLPGMGPKKEANILKELQAYRRRTARALFAEVEPLARHLVSRLAELEAVDKAALAGSLRRGRETVKDIDLVCASARPATVVQAFCEFPEVAAVIAGGDTRASVRLKDGPQADLRVVEPAAFAAALQYFTGSAEHNVRLRSHARKLGLKLNEYGLFRVEEDAAGGAGEVERRSAEEPERAPDGPASTASAEQATAASEGRPLAVPDEHSLYRRLGMAYIPPELREDQGEIEAALEDRLPDLIKLRDLRGDLHSHSTWSDGRHSIEEMHAAAAARGYEYLAVTDHSVSLVVANGLSPDRLRRQLDEIAALRERLGPPYLLTGAEVDILADGRLDFADDLLERLDLVVASVHSGFHLDAAAMTRRVLRAMENPHVDIVAHPTGRVLGRRDPYALDEQAVLEAAARTGTLLEINASPERLDLCDRLARRAAELGALLVINSDAHSGDGLAVMRFGVQVARRAWLEPEQVVNTWPLGRLKAFLALPKHERKGRRGIHAAGH